MQSNFRVMKRMMLRTNNHNWKSSTIQIILQLFLMEPLKNARIESQAALSSDVAIFLHGVECGGGRRGGGGGEEEEDRPDATSFRAEHPVTFSLYNTDSASQIITAPARNPARSSTQSTTYESTSQIVTAPGNLRVHVVEVVVVVV